MKTKKKVWILILIQILCIGEVFSQQNAIPDSLKFEVEDADLTTKFTGTYDASKDKFRNLKVGIYLFDEPNWELIKEINANKNYNIGGLTPLNILVDLPIGEYMVVYNNELKIYSVSFVNENAENLEYKRSKTLSSSLKNKTIDPLADAIQKQLILDEFIGEKQTFNLKFTVDHIYLNKQELPKKYHQKYLNIIKDFERKPTEKEPVDIWVIYSN